MTDNSLQEKAAAIKDEITALMAIPADFTTSQLHLVAPEPKKRKITTLRKSP
jgi:hypothetical protein